MGVERRRFAVVGASRRGWENYAVPIATKFTETAELVALCDISQIHMDCVNRRLPEPVPTFTNFDVMLQETAIDTIIVATVDRVHHEYIVKSLRAGKDVIVEKPMTIDDEKCRAILKAERETGRKVTVTFNYRFTPPSTAIRRIIADGTIGEVVTVDFHWPLDLVHGASYFRRWHGRRKNSGGLQVHKSTHHFDLVNWWLDDEPVQVMAQGGPNFYGGKGPFRHKRCKGCPHKDECRFYWDIAAWEIGKEFYIAAEEETGYIRDGCVFDEEIDIEDNYSLIVNYKGGRRLSYSLQAWSPWEGMQLQVQGTKGRLEYLEIHGEHDWEDPGDRQVIIMLNDGTRIVHSPPRGVGGHGGGDVTLSRMLFEEGHDDPMGHMAGTREAAHSILIGVAATKSMQNNGSWVRIADLL